MSNDRSSSISQIPSFKYSSISFPRNLTFLIGAKNFHRNFTTAVLKEPVVDKRIFTNFVETMTCCINVKRLLAIFHICGWNIEYIAIIDTLLQPLDFTCLALSNDNKSNELHVRLRAVSRTVINSSKGCENPIVVQRHVKSENNLTSTKIFYYEIIVTVVRKP